MYVTKVTLIFKQIICLMKSSVLLLIFGVQAQKLFIDCNKGVIVYKKEAVKEFSL